jgi:hypothetical protein
MNIFNELRHALAAVFLHAALSLYPKNSSERESLRLSIVDHLRRLKVPGFTESA